MMAKLRRWLGLAIMIACIPPVLLALWLLQIWPDRSKGIYYVPIVGRLGDANARPETFH